MQCIAYRDLKQNLHKAYFLPEARDVYLYIEGSCSQDIYLVHNLLFPAEKHAIFGVLFQLRGMTYTATFPVEQRNAVCARLGENNFGILRKCQSSDKS
jgi:hypothetical protein